MPGVSVFAVKIMNMLSAMMSPWTTKAPAGIGDAARATTHANRASARAGLETNLILNLHGTDVRGPHQTNERRMFAREGGARTLPRPAFGFDQQIERVIACRAWRTCTRHQPRQGLVERGPIEREDMLAAAASPGHEPGLLENPDVLRHGVERHVERPGQVGHSGLPGG